MPGPEDYDYVHEDDQQAVFEPAQPEVSQADSNPAYYPPEAKSEDLLTDDEKAELKAYQEAPKSKDAITGTGEVFVKYDEDRDGPTAEANEEDDVAEPEPVKEPEPAKPAAKSVPKSSSKS